MKRNQKREKRVDIKMNFVFNYKMATEMKRFPPRHTVISRCRVREEHPQEAVSPKFQHEGRTHHEGWTS